MSGWNHSDPSDHTSEIPQVKEIMTFGWSWQEVFQAGFVKMQSGLNQWLC